MNRPTHFFAYLLLALASSVAVAADLGAPEWTAGGDRECVVGAALGSPAAHEFHAVFARHWCLQGWSATAHLALHESPPARGATRIDILRDERVLLTVPLSPYVGQNLDRVAAAVVGQLGAVLVQADRDAASSMPPVPDTNRPGH